MSSRQLLVRTIRIYVLLAGYLIFAPCSKCTPNVTQVEYVQHKDNYNDRSDMYNNELEKLYRKLDILTGLTVVAMLTTIAILIIQLIQILRTFSWERYFTCINTRNTNVKCIKRKKKQRPSTGDRQGTYYCACEPGENIYERISSSSKKYPANLIVDTSQPQGHVLLRNRYRVVTRPETIRSSSSFCFTEDESDGSKGEDVLERDNKVESKRVTYLQPTQRDNDQDTATTQRKETDENPTCDICQKDKQVIYLVPVNSRHSLNTRRASFQGFSSSESTPSKKFGTLKKSNVDEKRNEQDQITVQVENDSDQEDSVISMQ